MNGVIRLLSADFHPFEVAFFRGLFGQIIFAPLFARRGLAPLKTAQPGLHLVCGSLQAVGMTFSFLAVSMAPLAKLATLQFTVPLFGTLFAFLILREVVCARRITTLVIGILGTLVIIDPTANIMDLGSVLALKSTATSALVTIIVKILSWSENSTTNVLYSTMLMTPLTLIPAFFLWVDTDRRTTPMVGAPRLPGYGFQLLLRPGTQGKRSEGVDGHRIHPAHLVNPDRLSRLR